MILRLEFHLGETLHTDDLDELTVIVIKAVDKALGESDYVVADYDLDFEVEDHGEE